MDLRQRIHDTLAAHQPEYLEVVDESHRHARGGESHYKVTFVSQQFEGQRLLRRHQAVHAMLGPLMGRFHALALHTLTPEEWAQRAQVPDSPACRGGGLLDRQRES